MKKLSISILLLFVMILSITAVAAADDVTSDLAKSQIADDSAALAVDDNTDVLAAEGTNFTTVQGLVDSASTGIPVTLDTTYTRTTTDKAILIDKEVTISGGKLDAANLGGIFNITSNGKLTLANVELISGNSTNGAIYNNGQLVISAVTFTTTTNSSAIYNDVSGTLNIAYSTKAVAFDGGSDYAIYNKGTITSIDRATKADIYNNGTIEAISEATFAKGIENYGTIKDITELTQTVPTITNNGTITSMKGKYTTVTNNGNIGTIIGEVTTLANNGTITTINKATIGSISNEADSTIATIDNVTISGAVENSGLIGTISNSKLQNYILNRVNATITTIDNVTLASSITNKGTMGTIKDSTIEGGVASTGDIDAISNTTFKKYLTVNNVNSIDKVTVTSTLTINGNVTSISGATLKASMTNNGNITSIKDTTFESALTNDGKIDSIDNATVAGTITNAGVIGTINKVTAPKLDNYGNITTITNSNSIIQNGEALYASEYEFTAYADPAGIREWATGTVIETGVTANGYTQVKVIENSVAGWEGDLYYVISTAEVGDIYELFTDAGVTSTRVYVKITGVDESDVLLDSVVGKIDSMDNVTAEIRNMENSTIGTISNSNILVYNYGNITTISDSTINGTGIEYMALENTGIIGSINNANFISSDIENDGNLTITDSSFNAGKTYNGAIININNCNFNASDIFNEGVAVITGSTFVNLTAENYAIYNYGNLTLSGNTINKTAAKIINGEGFITNVIITVLTNEVYNYAEPVTLNATLTDVDGNWIYDEDAFVFVINGTNIAGTFDYNDTSGVYSLEFTPAEYADKNITNANQVVTAVLADKYVNATATVTNGTLTTIKGTFTELQYLIDHAGTNLVLPYDFAYNAEFDNVNLTKGVVLNQEITIEGNGSTISGANVARIFFANATGIQIKNMTLINGNADNGSAIYVNNTAYIYNVTFTDNVAAENGGAIYATGEYATITYSTFKNNVANAGNAIYVNAGRLSEYNNTISNTTADIVNFNGTLAIVKLNITILGNKTINATYGEAVTLTAIIADTNGNLINDPFFYFTISTDKIAAVFDAASNTYVADTKLYYGPNVYEVGLKTNRTHSAQVLTVATGAYNISKAAPTLVVDIPNVVTGQNATVTLTLTGANGDSLNATDVPVIVNNKEYKVNITNGTGNVTLPVLDNGVYNAFVNYTGDDNYNGSYVATDFAVRTATKMTVTASDVTYDGATIAVTLTDGNGVALTKFVTVTVDGKDYTVAVTNGAGSQVITGLAANAAYPVTAAFAGDSDYDQASAETIFTIAGATVTAENIKRGVNSPFDYYVTVTDANGNPIADKEITIYVNGTKYTAKTNATGIATVAAGLTVVNETATVYDVIVVNPDTGANITATTTIVPRIVVLSGDLTADYLENPPYIVQAFGDDGNPVGEGEIVTVVFSGYFYYMPTNATGHVVRTIGLAPGLYAVKAGYKDYNATATIFSVKQILTASSGTLKKTAKSYTLKATLKNTNGKAIAGKEVKLTFNGKTYKVKTNSKGVASYTIKSSVISKLTAGKTYKLTAKYVNDLTKGKYVGKIKVVKK